MSLFEITPEIQLLAKPISPGYHGLELTKIEDKQADAGYKVTMFVHKVIDGPHKGAFVFLNVNHNETMAYNLDYLNFITKGQFSKPGKFELNMANCPVKKFDGQIVNKDVDGRIMNNLKKVRALTTEAEKAKELAGGKK